MNQREWSARLHVPTVGAMALIVAVWSLASWRYGAYVLPSPLSVVRGFVDIVASGEVWTHTGASLSRIFVGFGEFVDGACRWGLPVMGVVYRLSGGEKFRAIVIPSTLPFLVAGMKVGFGLALKVSVVAEIFGVTSGIGYIMNYSREILATQMVFVWALVMILVM